MSSFVHSGGGRRERGQLYGRVSHSPHLLLKSAASGSYVAGLAIPKS